jgi:hypothetical protein
MFAKHKNDRRLFLRLNYKCYQIRLLIGSIDCLKRKFDVVKSRTFIVEDGCLHALDGRLHALNGYLHTLNGCPRFLMKGVMVKCF